MDDQVRQILSEVGFDIDDALLRFLGNETLFLRCLSKFVTNTYFDQLKEAIDKKDCKEAFAASHALKGVCANLSLQSLYHLFSLQSDAFRNQDFDYGLQIQKQISQAYSSVIPAIQAALAKTSNSETSDND